MASSTPLKLLVLACSVFNSLTLDVTASEAGHHHHHHHHKHHPKGVKTEHLPPTPEQHAAADAINAHRAADSAQVAASVANKVAAHTVSISGHAQQALDHAEDALHLARVDGAGLSKDQRETLRKSERKVGNAIADQAQKKETKSKLDQDTEAKKELQKKLAAEAAAKAKAKAEADKADKLQANTTKAVKSESDLVQMKSQLQEMGEELRQMREARGETEKWDLETEIHDLEEMIEKLEAEEAKKTPQDRPQSHDELKAEVERLREAVDQLKAQGGPPRKQPEAPEAAESAQRESKPRQRPARLPTKQSDEDASPVQMTTPEEPVRVNGIDVDTEMPYGELEPFGREDTAQELTESSVKESDEMVDQLERAEVAEEKRSVFRALTRLRGAAITSFDGVARSQTGNIDEYNKIHKWRRTHPLHHLADEESDITKWAFPNDADF